MNKKSEDPTQLLATFQVTEFVGIVSLLYGMLLHSGAQSRGDMPPSVLPAHTLAVISTGLRMLNHIATLDLQVFQVRGSVCHFCAVLFRFTMFCCYSVLFRLH